MRVTNQLIVDQSLRRLQTRLAAFDEAQDRTASGKRVHRASDDPTGASRILGLRATERSRQQQARNADDAEAALNAADDALGSMVERLHRVRVLVTAGANEQGAANARAAMASEVASIRDELVAVANSRHDGRPVFSGFADADAVRFDGSSYSYGGDDGQVTRRLGDSDTVVANITGDEAFGFAGGSDVFNLLLRIEGELSAGDQGALSSSIDDLGAALETLGNAQARIGSSQTRVLAARERNLDAMLTLRGELSLLEDVDLAEAVMELQMQEVAYQATLGALGRALPPSLLSFLG